MSVATHKDIKIMKKEYINPAMDIVQINATQQLLAGSVTLAGELESTDPILSRELDVTDSFDLGDSDVTDFDNF